MRKNNFIKPAFLAMLICFAFGFASAQNIVYLSEGGNDNNNGSTSELAVATLGKAYELIGTNGGTIKVSGTVDGYTKGANSNDDGICPFLGNNSFTLTVEGVEGTNARIVGDNGAVRMFRLRSDMLLKLKDLTLSGDSEGAGSSMTGGAVRMDGGSLEAENVIFENFLSTASGAAIYVNDISASNPLMSFKNCVFRKNDNNDISRPYGAALCAWNTNRPVEYYFENCAFLDNSSATGTTVFRQSLAENIVKATFINSTFTGNTNLTGHGGCITVISTPVTLNVINCTIKDNAKEGNIGCTGIRISDGATAYIYNSIIENNIADNMQRDLNFNVEPTKTSPTYTIKNSFINAATGATYTNPTGYVMGELLNDFDATTNTFTPKAGSLAIGAGDKQYLANLGITTDQLGNKRLFENDLVDAGAVEVGVSPIWASNDGDDTNGDGTENNPMKTLAGAFAKITGSAGIICVDGAIDAGTTGTGLDVNGKKLLVKGLEGSDAKITTGGDARMFNVRNAGAVLTLKNLHLAGTVGESLIGQGGCISIVNGDGVFVENVTFENFSTALNPVNDPANGGNQNNDTGAAGVIFLGGLNASSSNPMVSFKNCMFRNNFTTGNWGGGVMRVQDFGTAANPHIYFENCGFYGSRTERGNPGGSVIVTRTGNGVNPQVSFVNSTITACGEGASGIIAISADVTLNVINSTIKDNSVSGIWSWEQSNVKINIYNSVIENNTGTNMNDVRLSEHASSAATIVVNNSLINNPLWRNVEAYGGTIPYTRPAGYVLNQHFNPLNETTISFSPKYNEMAANFGAKEFSIFDGATISYDQLGQVRGFAGDKCSVGAIEITSPEGNIAISSLGYATFSAPETCTITGAKVYYASKIENDVITLKLIENSIIPANTGVILQEIEGETASCTFGGSATAITDNLLKGTYEPTPISSGYYLSYDENDEVGFASVAASKAGKITIPAWKAYLENTGGVNPAPALTVKFDDGSATGIDKVSASQPEEVDVYSIDGRIVRKAVKFEDATTNLPKGLYIVGGKKIAVR